MTFTVSKSPWVTLRKGDPSFQLQGDFTIANRAGILINPTCPKTYADLIAQAFDKGYIECVATVPKNDPTYMWETLRKE
jgi:hypothetical protein